jgi:hypothetical protein
VIGLLTPKYRKIPQLIPSCLPYDHFTHTRSPAKEIAALILASFSLQEITEAVSWNAKARLAKRTVGNENDWKGKLSI